MKFSLKFSSVISSGTTSFTSTEVKLINNILKFTPQKAGSLTFYVVAQTASLVKASAQVQMVITDSSK